MARARVQARDQGGLASPWRLLPTRQLGCGSPITCWRRLHDWRRAGVWQWLHQRLLDELGREGQLELPVLIDVVENSNLWR